MSVFIEDSPRNLGPWISESVASGIAQGTVLTPWASPWIKGYKPSIKDRVAELHGHGVEVWFDPTTHALQMSGVGDFRYYDEYSLWYGTRGDLSDPANREEHVGRVFQVQDELTVQHLGPTVLLHSTAGNDSAVALELAREAVRRDPDAHLTIAGTTSFWSSGVALDAHVGALDALAPGGWFLAVVRPDSGLPVKAHAEEVHGLCRTARALGAYVPVHVSHGDLAGLPAIAAGATSVGSGWDQRQRVCCYADYGPRDPGSTGGGWYMRPTLIGLLGSISRNEALLLQTRDAALVAQLGGLPVLSPRDAFDHHLSVLTTLIQSIQLMTDFHQKYQCLRELYLLAEARWPTVQGITLGSEGATEWLAALRTGLDLYATTEGWL